VACEGAVTGAAAADLSELFSADCFMPIGAGLPVNDNAASGSNVSDAANMLNQSQIGEQFDRQSVKELFIQNANSDIDHQEKMLCHQSDLVRYEVEQMQKATPIQSHTKPSRGHFVPGQHAHGPTVHGQIARNQVNRNEIVNGRFGSGQIGRPPLRTTAAKTSGGAENGVPELTSVNMFWNDLPGLVLGGREHVRLVDIHKQIMPAKDTGILKKRCLMMGLAVGNCSELQRDFLVRYMGAAKSKSTVVIERDDAIQLIGKFNHF